MSIQTLQNNWETLAREDAMWAVLTDPTKKGKKWNKKDFFQTGDLEINQLLQECSALQIKLNKKRALDFGCGVGRLSQAIGKHFDEVTGVDIAPSMIEQAKKYHKLKNNLTFVVNSKNNLEIFSDKSFDFVYSNITLQHMPPDYAKKYIREFLRVLNHRGILVFQLPSEPAKTLKGLFISLVPFVLLTKLRKNMEMHATKKEDVVRYLERQGAEIIKINRDHHAGSGWISHTYFVRKKKK